MRGMRFSGILAGIAVAALASAGSFAQQPDPPGASQTMVPAPESSDVPPPMASDSEARSTTATAPEQPSSAAPATAIGEPPAPPAEAPAGLDAKDPLEDIASAPIASSIAPEDMACAEQLRERVATRLERSFARKKEREAVQAFYVGRGFEPLWIESGGPNGRADAAIARLNRAAADGLDAGDYPIPDFAAAAASPGHLAEAELKLTAAVLAYARHAQSGRIHPGRIGSTIEYALPAPEPAEVLRKIAESRDVARAIEDFNPPHEGFRALRRKLAEARERKPERSSAKALPSRPGLPAGGNRPAAAGEVSDGPRREREIDAIISNMERWRWLPRDLGRAYVMINVPDFTLKVVRDGKTVFRTKIVVGKPETPTPVFSDAIENIVVNPTWYVPPSIIYNEYLPALRRDPSVLARMGLIVERRRGGGISIRQPPSERNALGRLKFNFPNRFLVYLHDTPQKHLFAQDRRAYSHGCMRVQNPDQLAEVLLSIALPREAYTAQRLQSMFGKGEAWIRLPHHIPVHVTYMNAYVDDAGKLVVRDDLYGIHRRVEAALKGTDRIVADTPPAAVRRGADGPPAAVRAVLRTDRPNFRFSFQRSFEWPDARPGGHTVFAVPDRR